MEKKEALLVQFIITTRIIANSDDSEEKVTNQALEKIKANVDDYLIDGNLEGIYRDIECPYDPEFDN